MIEELKKMLVVLRAGVATMPAVDLVGKYESTTGVGSTPDSHGSITINGDVDVDEVAMMIMM